MLNRDIIVNKLIDEHSASFSEEFTDFLFEEIEKKYLFKELSTFFFLKEEVKKCEPYDGWTSEEQIDAYIKSNGFNSIEALEEQTKTLLNIFSNYISIDNIISIKKIDLQQAANDLEKITSEIKKLNFKDEKLIINFICDVYFSKETL